MAKVMVSLPDDLLAELDAEAKRRETTRSGLLAEAARREVARRDPELVRAAIERSERRFAAAPPLDAGYLVRLDRDEHDVRTAAGDGPARGHLGVGQVVSVPRRRRAASRSPCRASDGRRCAALGK